MGGGASLPLEGKVARRSPGRMRCRSAGALGQCGFAGVLTKSYIVPHTSSVKNRLREPVFDSFSSRRSLWGASLPLEGKVARRTPGRMRCSPAGALGQLDGVGRNGDAMGYETDCHPEERSDVGISLGWLPVWL